MRALPCLALLIAVCAPSFAAPKAVDRPLTRLEAQTLIDSVQSDLVDLWWWHTDELQHTGRAAQILGICDLVNRLDPTFVEAHSVGAFICTQRGDYPQAVARYEAGIAANPGHWQLYHELGLLYTRQKRWQQAQPYLEKAIARHPPVFAYRTYAHCLAEVGRRAEAIKVWRQILAANPTDAVAQREIARLEAAGKGK